MAGQNIFNSVKMTSPGYNRFDLTHDVKLSCDMGKLVPICVQEVIPGDVFNVGCEALIRFAPMIAPVMHRFDVTMHYFFVPNRILWDEWEDWIVGKQGFTGEHPTIEFAGGTVAVGDLADYMGIPPNEDLGDGVIVSAFPFAAYQAIYNEYYRDQNLIAEVDYKLTAGDNSSRFNVFAAMRLRAWMHDYFTSSLPFAQKGPAVNIPVAADFSDVDVYLKAAPLSNMTWKNSSGTGISGAATGYTPGAIPPSAGTAQVGGVNAMLDPADNLKADTSSLTLEATTINDLRKAFRLQEFLEKDARGGTRYTESIRVHFGVVSSDARLQRPEYITGIKSPITISEVLNTTGETSGLPQGNMAGHGVGYVSGKYGHYRSEEHGYIIGIMSIMPVTAYQQGVAKHFLKYSDRFLYYWPEFANIGEQPVENREIYAYGATPTGIFGYVPRYAEYRFEPSRVAGEFRTTLDYWHMGRIFNAQPALNQSFIECVPGKRIFAVESDEENSVYVHVLNKISAVRPMPKYGVPTF